MDDLNAGITTVATPLGILYSSFRFWLLLACILRLCLPLCFVCLFVCSPVPIPSESHHGNSAQVLHLLRLGMLCYLLCFVCFDSLACLLALSFALFLFALLLTCHYFLYLLAYYCFISRITHVYILVWQQYMLFE